MPRWELTLPKTNIYVSTEELLVQSSEDEVIARHKLDSIKEVKIQKRFEPICILFGVLGIGVAVLTDLVLGKLQEGFSTRGITHLMPMTNIDGKTVVSIKIPPTAGTEERTLDRIPLPDGTLVALVIARDGSVSIPTADTPSRPPPSGCGRAWRESSPSTA